MRTKHTLTRIQAVNTSPTPIVDVPSRPDLEWQEHGKCVVNKIDPRVFDGVKLPNGRMDYSAAKAICGSCPVRFFCLEDAIETDSTDCVRGGLAPKEYQALKKDSTRRAVPLKKPGTKRARQKVAA